jgi:hypothetical protein
VKRVACVMALALLFAGPREALAHARSESTNAPGSSTCVIRSSEDGGLAYRRLQCIAGRALQVSPSGMSVRPVRGVQRRLRFTQITRFETDSGEGVLDGLVSGDFVCAAYTSRAATAIAQLVLFDPNSMPCGSRARKSTDT